MLRDELPLTGAKEGCGPATAAHAPSLDGRMMCSCLFLGVEAQGKSVKTIEGIADGEKIHLVQHKFLEHAALQCGLCTPGMIVAAKTLLVTIRSDRKGVRYWLAGNLCRCTGYDKVICGGDGCRHSIEEGLS